MPTAVASQGTKTTPASGKPSQRSKKPRIARRRGRVQSGSDDEIEREARSDSDSDNQSSLDSESDSETASDDDHHGGIVTPSTTQSPPPLDIHGSSAVKPDPIATNGSGPFVETTDWAQIVADETNGGGGDLPVIDFADLHTHAIPEPPRAPPRSKKAQKQAKKASANRSSQPPPAETAKAEEPPQPVEAEPVASSSQTAFHEPSPPRNRSQSARQAYQERLQQDPAFVPRVGEFWGHDDRLLDKDLRSLSGWWRGRWHTRGRGRGAFPMRGRGGRGAFTGRPPLQEDNEPVPQDAAETGEDVPAIERAWTHDGFEEMKRREEQRRPQPQAQAQSTVPQTGTPFRGRGGSTAARGRGGATRGAHAGSPHTPRSENWTDAFPKRPWFAMKPEKMWTKHADSFLYMDAPARFRSGPQGGVRVKIPGHASQVLRPFKTSHKANSLSGFDSGAPSSTLSTDDGERHFVVRFPKKVATGKLDASQDPFEPADAAAPTASRVEKELSIEEVFTVRPHAVPSHVPLDIKDHSQPPSTTTDSPSSPPVDVSALPDLTIQRQLEQLGLGIGGTVSTSDAPNAMLEESLLRHPSAEDSVSQTASDETRPAPPPLHPLQTSFSPVPPTSPPYGSPYQYGHAMPPGIAMSHQGYPYEVSTGRPVYLQHPPPPQMYTPRPIMHPYMAPPPGVPFIPGHMSHPSQEFVPHTHTPVNGFMDLATGIPIFSPARQNSRIEIRAPTDRGEGPPTKLPARPSSLRSSLAEVQSVETNGVSDEGAHAPQGEPEGQPPQQAAEQRPMMGYAPYPPQYYYPDPNAYSAYMDMSPQMHYELYPPHDQRAHQPIIYY